MTSLRIQVWIVLSGFCCILALACNPGIYGSRCQFKCHCNNSLCTANGECQYRVGCEKGWMGPMCQYQDLGVYGVRDVITVPAHNGSLLVDGDADTCVKNVKDVTIEFWFRSRLTWLQLIGENLNGVKLTFKEYRNGALFTGTCKDGHFVRGTNQILNVVCYSDTNVEVMKLEMESPVKLCSILINGGRNLALSGLATQSSTLPSNLEGGPAEASRAVDGNTNTDYHYNSCTHTNEVVRPATPWWNLQLPNRTQTVNRLVIYNRLDGALQGPTCCPWRLNGFTMDVFNYSGANVFHYIDQPPSTTFKGEVVYNLTTPDFVEAYRVNISAHSSEAILTLCEVEMYGYEHCPNGKYGPECSKTCHCKNETCDEINGLCKFGCEDGISGFSCDFATNSATTSRPTGTGIVHQDYTCYFSYMDVYIPVSLTPSAKLWLRDPSCQFTNNGTHYVINVPYSSCSTEIQNYINYTVMTNTITVHTDIDDSGPVVFGDDYTIDLSCTIPKHQEVDGSFQAVTGDPIVEISENKTLGFQLKEFETAEYIKDITKYPVQIDIHRDVFLELSLSEKNRLNNTLGINVDNCKATPTSDPNDKNSYALISNGCTLSSHGVHIQNSPGPEFFRFSFHGFLFPGSNNNNTVYIHCDVSTCPKSACANQCAAGRRKRRSNVNILVTLTAGPYLIVDNGLH